jgi:hypothetical protein
LHAYIWNLDALMQTLRVAALALAGSLLLAACRRADPPEATRASGTADSTAIREIEWEAEDGPAEPLPERIYYDLTRFEWYARGEPLMFESHAYSPRGEPVRASATAMRKVGDFQGVEVYRADNEASAGDVLYVPVFEGFWLPFVSDSTAPRTP